MFKKIVFLISKKPNVNALALGLARQCRLKPIESTPSIVPQNRLILLALIDPRPLMQTVQDSGRKESDVQEEMESKAWRELYQLEYDFKKSGEEVEIAVAVEKSPLFEIQPFLKTIKADLLILPIEWLRFYNYTISEKFLAELPCPVLLVGKP